jgi:tartrate dehydratase alpha subunit/fumarate hydratase class I-like protein
MPQNNKIVERVVRGVEKAARQNRRREVVKERLEKSEGATHNLIVVPAFHLRADHH